MQVLKSVKKYAEFVYGSSELNLLHLPFFRNGKDPLEDFDYNDPSCNPLLRPAAARTPSHTTAHQLAICSVLCVLLIFTFWFAQHCFDFLSALIHSAAYALFYSPAYEFARWTQSSRR
ncbi:mitogen-activated protein kinase-binding protein 1 [Dorcoceras hygrometricum]|uniref:Mitogen-activated protein kinase-binding protein 1 n=1 Tax=Dorcoceras hygrometricum TaxID=472368 RepID=A0A2Z7BGU4_9LAMI|nr:mitogen-activated protein kinase-binding protein 1 [Dorcoceras hygrometricum]